MNGFLIFFWRNLATELKTSSQVPKLSKFETTTHLIGSLKRVKVTCAVWFSSEPERFSYPRDNLSWIVVGLSIICFQLGARRPSLGFHQSRPSLPFLPSSFALSRLTPASVHWLSFWFYLTFLPIIKTIFLGDDDDVGSMKSFGFLSCQLHNGWLLPP